ncbi:MAG: mevalonate kinase [Chloroflexi bacterium]|nr:mevalonate kinase [Chloroflexota bacterium]
MKPIVATAPGKLILFGEHAVVHGQPALAVPLTALRATVTAEPTLPNSGLHILMPDSRHHHTLRVHLGEDTENGLVYTAQLVLKTLGVATPPDLKLILHSTIPLAAGFGSGAAVSAALARALAQALHQPFDNETLNELVYEVEKIHHGTPSGIDNTVIVYQQPVYFVRGKPLETFTIPRPFLLVVGNLGHATPTHITVDAVRDLAEQKPQRIQPIFNRIGAIAAEARGLIESGQPNLLGPLMDENHALLCELTVSDDELDQFCRVAKQAGAMGAKLSGGGRGGNMIALVDEKTAPAVQEVLKQAGAASVFTTQVG